MKLIRQIAVHAELQQPATWEEKIAIVAAAQAKGLCMDPYGEWPNPFSSWDARCMLAALKGTDNDH